MDYSIFDIEGDDLDATKIYCMCIKQYRNGVANSFTLMSYSDMARFLASESILVGHNIIRWDIPTLERLLGIKIQSRLIDTLGLSWYLFPSRAHNQHGLEDWGEEFGVPKPKISDWKNLPLNEYVHRCSEDVKINDQLFTKCIGYLKRLYRSSQEIDRLMNYISFKLDCAREQEQVKWKLDVAFCEESLAKLIKDHDAKVEVLRAAMPKKRVYQVKKKPKVTHKIDGSHSLNGVKWYGLLEEMGLPSEYEGEIKVQVSEEEPNPGSHAQIKDWLDSLGWVPRTFKFVQDEEHHITKKVPQINTGEGVCESVKDLYDKEPALEHLDGLFMIRHRIGLLKGFLRDKDENGYLKAEVAGFTNTMRFMHTTIVNLPSVSRPYGKEIRGCLTVESGELLCGSDMSSLEDTTKQHYIYYYDPNYVTEMRVPGFDPHLDIAMQGAMVTEEESNFFKWMEGKLPKEKVSERYLALSESEQKNEYKRIGKKRKDAKPVNFSAVYGVGKKKLSQTTGWPEEKSENLLSIYWKRNWAVRCIAEACTVVTIDGQMWLWNAMSKLYYSLRFEKDRFSTLNQGSGVFCFDNYVREVRSRGVRISGQFHDEIAFKLREERKEEIRTILNDSIKAVNDHLKLNVPLGISMDFGKNYAETH